jgi:hypothetical protein
MMRMSRRAIVPLEKSINAAAMACGTDSGVMMPRVMMAAEVLQSSTIIRDGKSHNMMANRRK